MRTVISDEQFAKVLTSTDPLAYLNLFHFAGQNTLLTEEQTRQLEEKAQIYDTPIQWMLAWNQGHLPCSKGLADKIFYALSIHRLEDFFMLDFTQFRENCEKLYGCPLGEYDESIAVQYFCNYFWTHNHIPGTNPDLWGKEFGSPIIGIRLTKEKQEMLLSFKSIDGDWMKYSGLLNFRNSFFSQCTHEKSAWYADEVEKYYDEQMAKGYYLYDPGYGFLSPAEKKEELQEELPEESKRAFPTSWKEADKLLNLQYGVCTNLQSELRKALLLVENRVFHHFEFLSIHTSPEQWEKSMLPEALSFLYNLSSIHTQIWDELLTCQTHLEFMTLWMEAQKKLFPGPKKEFDRMPMEKEFFELEKPVELLRKRIEELAILSEQKEEEK